MKIEKWLRIIIYTRHIISTMLALVSGGFNYYTATLDETEHKYHAIYGGSVIIVGGFFHVIFIAVFHLKGKTDMDLLRRLAKFQVSDGCYLVLLIINAMVFMSLSERIMYEFVGFIMIESMLYILTHIGIFGAYSYTSKSTKGTTEGTIDINKIQSRHRLPDFYDHEFESSEEPTFNPHQVDANGMHCEADAIT